MPQQVLDNQGIPKVVAGSSADGGNILVAGTRTATSVGNVVFSNANGVTFGLDAPSGTIMTASIAGGGGGGDGGNVIAAGTRTATSLGTVIFSNANGITFGLDAVNGSQVTASHNALTSQSNQAFSAGGGSSAFQTLSFSNANGISFSNNAGQVQASYTVPTLTNSTLTISDAATSIAISRLAFSQSNGLTLSLSTTTGGSATVVGSYTVPTVTNSSWTVSDNATSLTISRLAFTQSNGITMSLSTAAGAATVIASHNALTSQSNQQMTLFATGNTTQSSTGTTNASSLIFRGDGVASVGITNGSVVISVAGAGGADGFNRIAADTRTATSFGTVLFSDANGISFRLDAVNGSIVTASYTVPTVPAQFTGGFSTHGNTAGDTGLVTGRVLLVGSNAITLSGSTNAGSITVSINGPLSATTISGVTSGNVIGTRGSRFALEDHQHEGVYAVGFSTNGNTAGDTALRPGRLVLVGGNAITLSGATAANSLQTITISAANQTVQTQSLIAAVYDGANSISTGTIRFTNANGVTFSINGQTLSASVAAQSNQQMTMFATGNTILSSTGTSNASSLIFRGSGAASVGITNGSVLIDVAAGAAAITQSIGMSTQTAGGATAGTTGYVTGDDILYHFVPGSNITMSQSVDGASGTLSIYGPAAGGGITYSGYAPFYAGVEQVLGTKGQGSYILQPMWGVPAFQCDHLAFPVAFSNTSNSSGSVTYSWWIGVYTRNATTLSLLHSTSFTTALTMSGTVGSYTLYMDPRVMTIPWTTTIVASDYWLGIGSRSTTAGAGGMSMSYFVASNMNSAISGSFGLATDNTRGSILGEGVYSATQSTNPASIAFSHITGTASLHRRPIVYYFGSATL